MNLKDIALNLSIEILQKHKLTVLELLDFLSDLTYSIGVSIVKADNKELLPLEELEKMYFENPGTFKETVGYALVLQSNLMKSWMQELTDKEKK